MTIYQDAIQFLLDMPASQQWVELREAFERAKHHFPVAWHFPVKACEAVGGQPKAAISAVAAMTCVHMAIMLVDDILDEDPRGAYRQMGAGRAANLAVGLNALGVSVLLSANSCPQHEQASAALNAMMLNTSYGQDLDVENLQTEEGYWEVTRAKSSPYFGAALYIGALFGGASMEIADRLQTFGTIYGEIMQIHDDLNDSLAVPANVDWLAGRSPLPILFAQLVDHPKRDRFIDLRKQVENPEDLREAQSILVSCGAISYSVSELIKRHTLASELLYQIPLANPESLNQLLEEAIAPVRHLLMRVGVEMPVAD